jgi:hypothetical protein
MSIVGKIVRNGGMTYYHNYVYLTNCVDHKNGEDINEMTDNAVEINYRTFAAHTNPESLDKVLGEVGLAGGHKTIRGKVMNDWHVQYFRSKFNGNRCYYLVYSGIEYIFVDK